MTQVTVSRGPTGDELNHGTMSDCLQAIDARGDFVLYDGDLYWRPLTMLQVHTPQWLSRQVRIVWFPERAQENPNTEGVSGNVSFVDKHDYPLYMLVSRSSLPSDNIANLL